MQNTKKGIITKNPHSPLLIKGANTKFAITIVELIVVITILAILGTIAFLSFNSYLADSRDSVRISDTRNITSVLEVQKIKTGKYVLPDNGTPITYSGGLAWTQGTFGVEARRGTKSLSVIPTDPLTDQEYTYSVSNTQLEYEIGVALENGTSTAMFSSPFKKGDEKGLFTMEDTKLSVLPQTHASTETFTAYIVGNYNGQVIKVQTGSTDYVLAIPTIISSDISTATVESIISNKKLAVKNYKNVPAGYGITVDSSALEFVKENKLVVWSGSTSDISTGNNLKIFADNLQAAYSGTLIENTSSLKNIIHLDTTDSNQLNNIAGSIMNTRIGGDIVIAQNSTTTAPAPITDWRSVDPNCDIADITIGTQTWAGCNSTIGNGVEYTGNGDCYNYQGTDIGGTSCYGFDTTEYSYNSSYGVDNIWGKLYTWDNSSTACTSGYHVPSDAEWETLETTLNGNSNCRNSTLGWLCDGLGWENHTGKNTTNNLVEALKIPLSGIHIDSGLLFYHRGYSVFLWSSTTILGVLSYGRELNWNYSTVLRNTRIKSLSFSVRCIKD